MAYSESQINKAVSTVHMNSRRQAKRALVTNFCNGDINYIGNCCFAYSGEFTASTSLLIGMEFTTGPNFIKGIVRIAGMTDMGSPSTGSRLAVRVCLNSSYVEGGAFADADKVALCLHSDGSDKDMPFSDSGELIIPPFTKVQFLRDGNQTSTGQDGSISFTGKVYAGAEIIQGAI